MRRLCIVLHLNQNVTAFASVAAVTSYRKLLVFLREDASRKLTLHVSGTLLIALGWLEPDVLAGIRELVELGQIELLGSTFAQNIPHVTPAEDNDLQIVLHHSFLREWFGVRPSGFWNPERCWGAAYAELIARHDYAFTFLEDHIIASGGLPDHAGVGSVRAGDRQLLLVRDDHRLRQLVNGTIWGHGGDELVDYVDHSPRPLFCFAEDGEAIGLWALEQRHDPDDHWRRLAEVIARLQQSGLVMSTCSEAVAAATPVAMQVPPDGQASWMVEALNNPGSRFHEGGFADWFDYARRNDKLTEQLALVAATRADVLPVLVKRAELSPIEAQLQISYCVHEYELGCIGVLTLGPGQFTKLRNATLLAQLARLVHEPGPTPRWVQLGRGLDAWVTEHDVIAIGAGAIVAWFDRASGHALCTSDIETSIDDQDDGKPMVDEVQMWIENYRYGRDPLDPQGLRDVSDPRFVARHPRVLLFQGTAVPALFTGDRAIALTFAGATREPDRVIARWTADRATIERELAVTARGVAIRDRITHDRDEPLRYVLRHTLSPGYDVLARRGSAALASIAAGAFVAEAGIGVQLRAHRAEVSCPGAGLLSVLVDLTWSIDDREAVVAYSLHKLRAIDDVLGE